MKKNEFIKEIARRTLMSQKAVADVLESTAGTIRDELSINGECGFPGLGKFKLVDIPERNCYCPATGSRVVSQAHEKVKFKISKGFMG